MYTPECCGGFISVPNCCAAFTQVRLYAMETIVVLVRKGQPGIRRNKSKSLLGVQSCSSFERENSVENTPKDSIASTVVTTLPRNLEDHSTRLSRSSDSKAGFPAVSPFQGLQKSSAAWETNCTHRRDCSPAPSFWREHFPDNRRARISTH